MTPVRRWARRCYARVQVEPGQDVGSVDESLLDHDVGHDLRHLLQGPGAGISALYMTERAVEDDVVGQYRPERREISALPGAEVCRGHPLRILGHHVSFAIWALLWLRLLSPQLTVDAGLPASSARSP